MSLHGSLHRQNTVAAVRGPDSRIVRVIVLFVVSAVLGSAATVSPARDFGLIAVNPSTPATASLSYSFTGLSTAPSFSLAYGTDFAVGAPSCSVGASTNCSVQVSFAPHSPGLRLDAVLVADESGNALGTTFLHGVGQAPQLAFYPGILTAFAGTGLLGDTGNNGPATQATLFNPAGLALDQLGNLYIADAVNQVVRKVNAVSGVITTAAGNGSAGYAGDGGPATQASLQNPTGVAIDGAGNLYIADQGNNRVRKVTPSGQISTVAGGGSVPSQADLVGDGGAATSAILLGPNDVAIDGSGNLYIADSYHGLLREVNAMTGVITVVAGGGSGGGSDTWGDGGPATNAILNNPRGLAVDAGGNLYVADSGHSLVREINVASGVISVVAGNGSYGYSGDFGPALAAALSKPVAVKVDAAGNVYIADLAINFIRVVQSQSGVIFTLTAAPSGNASLASPSGLTLDPEGNIYASSTPNNMVVKLNPLLQPATFGSENVGQVSSSSLITAMNVGNEPLDFTNIAFGLGFARETSGFLDCSTSIPIAAGSSCVIAVGFAPTAIGTTTGSLAVGSNSFFTPAQTAELKGTGANGPVPQAILSTAQVSFGNQRVGTAALAKTITLSNPGTAPLAILGLSLSGVNTLDFNTPAITCASTLPAGSSCMISVTFSPSAAGSRTASLSITDSVATSPQTIALSGTGIIAPVASLNPISLSFPQQNKGSTSSPQVVTLTNTGNASLNLSGVSVAGVNAADFTIISGCSGALAAGASCNVSVSFAPSAPGIRSASLTYTDNATPAQQTVALSGVGVGVPAASLSLNSLNFGAVSSGIVSPAEAVTLSNPGTLALTISSIAVTGANAGDFGMSTTCGSSLAINATCMISVVFSPTAGGARSAAVILSDSVTGGQAIALNGTGVLNASAAANPPSLTFPGQSVGTTTATQSVTFSNTGNVALNLSSASVGGPDAADFRILNTCPDSLAVAAKCTVAVTFSPSGAGSRIAALTFTDSAGNSPQMVSLTGTGLAAQATGTSVSSLTVSVGSLDFGVAALGSSGTQTVTISNPPASELQSVSAALSGANASQFVFGTNSCDGPLAAGANCAVTIQFSPVLVGNLSATLTITGSPSNSSSAVGLSGVGIRPFSFRAGSNDLQAVFRPSDGSWGIDSGRQIGYSWGESGDIPAPGDYDGDHQDDLAFFRPSTGYWWIELSGNPGAFISQQWGQAGDIPVPGDYDGDGKTDLAVWRPSTGQWLILSSSTPGVSMSQQWAPRVTSRFRAIMMATARLISRSGGRPRAIGGFSSAIPDQSCP